MPHKQKSHKFLYVVFFHLGDSPTSEFYVTLQNTLSVPSSKVVKMEQTECSETSPDKIQMPRNHLNERMQHSKNCKSLKSRSSHMANNEGTSVYVVLFSHQKKSLNNELNCSQISFQVGVRLFVSYWCVNLWLLTKKKKKGGGGVGPHYPNS